VNLLLERKIGDVNAKTNVGLTALMLAASRAFVDVTKALLKAGADPNLAVTDMEPGSTALHYAVAAESVDIVKLLLEHGAGVNSQAVARTWRGCERQTIQRG
jgi:ankyrin repeat protein